LIWNTSGTPEKKRVLKPTLHKSFNTLKILYYRHPGPGSYRILLSLHNTIHGEKPGPSVFEKSTILTPLIDKRFACLCLQIIHDHRSLLCRWVHRILE
jgi:hypothetical protein